MSVPASPSGSRASHEAAKASSPKASIADAVEHDAHWQTWNRYWSNEAAFEAEEVKRP